MQDAFHKQLRQRIEAESQKRIDMLANGMVSSMEEYKRAIGYLEAMRTVLEMSVDIEKQLYGNPTKGDR